MKSIKRYKRKIAAAQEDIKKLLSGEYGIACEFCIHEADMSVPCTKGDKEWCRQHACWKGGSRLAGTFDVSYLQNGNNSDTRKDDRSAGMTEKEAIGRLIDHFAIHKDDRPTPYLDKAKDVAIEALEEIQQYHAIGTVEESRKATEKQKSKKPIDRCMFYECPTCGNVHILYCKYCPDCGQKLDWNNDEVTDMENIEARR